MKFVLLVALTVFLQYCSGLRPLDEVHEKFKALPGVNEDAIDDLVEVFKKMRSTNSIEVLASYATLLSIVVEEDFHQSDRTAEDIWEVFYEHAIEMEFPDEKFMKKVARLLSKELTPQKVRDALNSSPEIDNTSPLQLKKDIHYVDTVFHNALGVSKRKVCEIIFANDSCNEYKD